MMPPLPLQMESLQLQPSLDGLASALEQVVLVADCGASARDEAGLDPAAVRQLLLDLPNIAASGFRVRRWGGGGAEGMAGRVSCWGKWSGGEGRRGDSLGE